MLEMPHHTFQVLTKRHERLAHLAPRDADGRLCAFSTVTVAVREPRP